jgi:hypothetical protein
MKLTYKNGTVRAIAESIDDVRILIALTTTPKAELTTTKHKKHTHMKTCELCSKEYKGLRGLKIHQVKCKKSIWGDKGFVSAVNILNPNA